LEKFVKAAWMVAVVDVMYSVYIDIQRVRRTKQKKYQKFPTKLLSTIISYMAVDVPDFISANAVRALENIKSKGGGVTAKTVREARQMAKGTVSEDKVTRMAAWFARHKSDLASPAANDYLNGEGKMTAGQWAWLAWGGDITTTNRMRAMKWAERTRDRLAKDLNSTSDEEPTVLKAYGEEDEYKDYSDDASGADAMTHLLMAYRLMLDHPECAPLLEPLMALVHMKEMIMLENVDETHVVIPAEMETDDESMLYRRTTRKVVVQEDGQFCVRSEESGRNFGCYRTVEMAEARLEQIESFAKRRIVKASNDELTAWHDRLHLSVSVTDGMVACHDVIEDELEARQKSVQLVKSMSGSLPVSKAEENRFTLGPVYVPGFEDAHGEFTDEDTLQKALWGWMKADDRTIYLQHSEKAAGEMVEMLTWPMPIETELQVPNEGVTKYAFPANTPFMGVIWEPWAWEMVKAGELRGYSIGGTSQRMEADLPTAALV